MTLSRRRGTLRIASFCGILALIAGVFWAMQVRRPPAVDGTPGVRQAVQAPAQPRVLRRGNGPEPESLDPHGARSEAALTILRDLYEGLTEIGAGAQPVLAAAQRYEVSADGLRYRFHLRPDGRWSNGDAVVAEDFAAAWRRLVDPHTAAPYADLLEPVRGALAIIAGRAPATTLGVRAVGADLLEIDLEHPTPYLLSILAHPATFPLHRASLAAHGRGFAKPGVMVSNGAFVLTRWDFGSHLVAVRNRVYWNAAATQLDGVEYYSWPEAAQELRAFRAGEVDITSSIPAAQFAWVRDHLGSQLHVAPQLAVYYLGLNLTRTPFAGAVNLRRALSMVIDRERIVGAVTGTGEAAAYTLVPPQTFGYAPPLPEYAHWPMAQRVARARQLLAQAGISGSLPPIELRYNTGELHGRIAIVVAQMWKEALGIDTTLRAEEFKVLLQDIGRGDVQAFRASWVGDYDDAYGFLRLLKTGAGLNLPRWSNGDYDALLQRASSCNDPQVRRASLAEAEALMLADQPLIPLYFYVAKHLVGSRVHGWSENVLNVVYSKSLSKEPLPLATSSP